MTASCKEVCRGTVGRDYLEDLYCKKMLFWTRDQYQELAESHGFAVTSMEDKDLPGLRAESIDVLIAFFVGLMHGELDL